MLNQILVALAFNGLDLMTGLIGAIREKNVTSSKMRDGLFKKIGFMLCYVLSYLVDTQSQVVGLSLGVKVLPIIVLYVVTTEIVSIIENISKINSDLLPSKLLEMFHISKED